METSSERGPVISVVLAFIIMVVVVVIVYLLVPHKITAMTVSKVDVFAPHTEFQASQGSMAVVGEPGQTEDDLYVVAHLNITDKLHDPVYISGWSGTVTFADGTTMDSTYIAKSSLPRLEQIFPNIATLVTDPLSDQDKLDPGVARSGSVILLFPNTTQDKWDKKGSAVLTLTLRDHASQTVKLP